MVAAEAPLGRAIVAIATGADNEDTAKANAAQEAAKIAGLADTWFALAGRLATNTGPITSIRTILPSVASPVAADIPAGSACIYVVGTMLIVAYNNAGTVNYNTIAADLTAGTTTPPT